MARQQSPTAITARFVEAINRRDVDALGALMSADHRLIVFDEAPLEGRDANIDAWRGYFTSFPDYVIYPHDMAERDGTVAVVGHTTGSHLGLPDDEESAMTLIWLADIVDGLVKAWRLVEDTPEAREQYGLR